MNVVALGRIGRAHGVHGEVRLQPYNASSPMIAAGRTLLVGGVERRIRSARAAGEMFVVTFDGVTSREAAAALTGAEVAIARSALPPPAEDEMYLVDLIGCACSTEGESLGTVVGVATYPASTCLVIEGDAGVREIPAVAPYLAAVDLDARRIELAHVGDFPAERPRPKKTP